MSVTNGPRRGLMINALTGDNFDVDFRKLLRAIDALLMCSVANLSTSAPPGSPANGNAYIVKASGTGAWAGHDNAIAIWSTDNPAAGSGEWEFYAPATGMLVYSVADAALYQYSGSAWVSATTGFAPLASPGFTGVPTAPTATLGTNTTQISTTAFVAAAIAALVASSPAALDTLNELATALADDPNFATTMTTALAAKAALASPALTGNPTAPTQAALDNSTKLATTAYGDAAVAVEKARALAAEGVNTTAIATNATAITAETTRATAAEALKAPLASPALTGSPTAPTQTALDNSTKIATTAYVDSAGFPRVVAKADATAQSANIGTATIYAVPVGGAGMYRITSSVTMTRAATTSSVLPAVQVRWTDGDSSAAEVQNQQVTNTANAVGDIGISPASYTSEFFAAASTNIQWDTTGYTSVGATTMQYAVHVRLEYLG